MIINESKLNDAFSQIFGLSGEIAFSKLQNKAENEYSIEHIKDEFLAGLLNSLQGVNDKMFTIRTNLVNSLFLETDNIWNLFSNNPAACGIAATLLQVFNETNNENQNLSYRQLISLAIPRYFAFLNQFLLNMQGDYKSLIEDSNSAEANFKKAVSRLKEILTNDNTKSLSMGISNVIEGLMYIRERRVEEYPITLDLNLGIYGSWDAIAQFSQDDSSSSIDDFELREKKIEADLKESIKCLMKIKSKPEREFVTDLEDAGKSFGRGVAVLKFSKQTSSEDSIVIDHFWSNHKGAPLSMLYGLDYKLPDPEEDGKTLNIILFQNGTISIQMDYDPFIDYFAGSWRYVDLYHKATILTKKLNQDRASSDANLDLLATIYRIARLSYQLGYHNHGATIEVIIGNSALVCETGKLDNKSKSKIGNNLNGPFAIKYDPDNSSEDYLVKIGRWVYQLCTVDGITRLNIDLNNDLIIKGYGNIIDVKKPECELYWKAFLYKIGASTNQPIGGGRHYSAYQCMIDGSKNGSGKNLRNFVFCISQDGYIDVYMKDDWLRAR